MESDPCFFQNYDLNHETRGRKALSEDEISYDSPVKDFEWRYAGLFNCLPPGIGDVSFTMGRSIENADRFVVVTTPRQALLADIRKSVASSSASIRAGITSLRSMPQDI